MRDGLLHPVREMASPGPVHQMVRCLLCQVVGGDGSMIRAIVRAPVYAIVVVVTVLVVALVMGGEVMNRWGS